MHVITDISLFLFHHLQPRGELEAQYAEMAYVPDGILNVSLPSESCKEWSPHT